MPVAIHRRSSLLFTASGTQCAGRALSTVCLFLFPGRPFVYSSLRNSNHGKFTPFQRAVCGGEIALRCGVWLSIRKKCQSPLSVRTHTPGTSAKSSSPSLLLSSFWSSPSPKHLNNDQICQYLIYDRPPSTCEHRTELARTLTYSCTKQLVFFRTNMLSFL